jgi:hypothetical protein
MVAVTVDIRGGTEPLYEQVIAEVFPEYGTQHQRWHSCASTR